MNMHFSYSIKHYTIVYSYKHSMVCYIDDFVGGHVIYTFTEQLCLHNRLYTPLISTCRYHRLVHALFNACNVCFFPLLHINFI